MQEVSFFTIKVNFLKMSLLNIKKFINFAICFFGLASLWHVLLARLTSCRKDIVHAHSITFSVLHSQWKVCTICSDWRSWMCLDVQWNISNQPQQLKISSVAIIQSSDNFIWMIENLHWHCAFIDMMHSFQQQAFCLWVRK